MQVRRTNPDLIVDVYDLPGTFTYDGSNNLLTDSRTDGYNTWVKTYTYTGNNKQTESAWVLQAAYVVYDPNTGETVP